MTSFSERLRDAFNDASMAEIARLLDVSHPTVQNYFKERLPAPEILIKIANKTNVSLNWLLTGEGDKFPNLLNGKTFSINELSNQLDDEILKEIESFREVESDHQNKQIPFDEFLVQLIYSGVSLLERDEATEEVSNFLDENINPRVYGDTLHQTVIRIIQNELFFGDSREIVTNIVKRAFFEKHPHSKVEIFDPNFKIKLENEKREKEIQELGNIDEFNLEESLRKYDDANTVLIEWYKSEGITDLGVDFGFIFSDWNSRSFEDKLDTVKIAKQLSDKAYKK